ncbi:hypothetical protein Anapl_00211 [Anas platyrhynchos]|uniref:Uncharacterized protein n=1 Tax=Anas platyrhynchos TaxID=8839 RepID=R0LQX3_ANAPL|nr:hypothetical protein Anapl_00211 [Anas platyrhynchos]
MKAAEKDIVEEKGSMLVKTGSLMHQHQSCSGTKQALIEVNENFGLPDFRKDYKRLQALVERGSRVQPLLACCSNY